jgi:hypothetical protein
MATIVCRFCQRPIGYETPFCGDPYSKKMDDLVHWNCLVDSVEAERKQQRQALIAAAQQAAAALNMDS